MQGRLPVPHAAIIDMNEVRIFSDSAGVIGLCQESKLPHVDIRDAEIDRAPFEMKTVANHAPAVMPQIFIICVRAVS